MSDETKTPKTVRTPFILSSEQMAKVPQRRWYDHVCAHCELPIGESQFCIGLKSGRSLHLDCYLTIYQHGGALSAA